VIDAGQQWTVALIVGICLLFLIGFGAVLYSDYRSSLTQSVGTDPREEVGAQPLNADGGVSVNSDGLEQPAEGKFDGRQIYAEILEAGRRAMREADVKIRLSRGDAASKGNIIQLTRRTALFPGDSLEDAISARGEAKFIPADCYIEVKERVRVGLFQWYEVTVTSRSGLSHLGAGWISEVALYGQVGLNPSIQKWNDLRDELWVKYEREIMVKHGLTQKELDQIFNGGFEQDWE